MSLPNLPPLSLSTLEKGPQDLKWSKPGDPHFTWRCTGKPIQYRIRVELVKEKSLELRAVVGLVALFALSLFVESANSQTGGLSLLAPLGVFLAGSATLFKWLTKLKERNEQVKNAKEQNHCFVAIQISFGRAGNVSVKRVGMLHEIPWANLFQELHPRLRFERVSTS